MKTCARCGRTYPNDQTVCQQCGLSLPGMRGLASGVSAGTKPVNPTVGHIDYLLTQMDEWVRQGWVAPEQARRLWDVYQERRRQIAPEPAPGVNPDAASTPAASPLPPIFVPAPIVTPKPRRVSPLAAFFEESNLSLWQLVGALLLLAGLVGLVRWTWDSVGKYLVLALMLGLTGGLFALTRSRFVREQPLTRSVLSAVAALLVPLDVVAVNAFRLLGGALGTPQIGLLTSLLCLPLYGWLARRESGRWPAGVLAANAAAAVYFGLQALLPGSAASEGRGIVYGLSYAGLALAFLLAGWRMQGDRRRVWLGTAHVSALSALAFALWLGGPGTVGAASAALLLIGIAYSLAAALYDDRNFVFMAQSALSVGGVLALHRIGGGDWLEHWYVYAVWVQVVGLASWAVGLTLGRQGREALAAACRDGGLLLTGLAMIAQAVRMTVALVSFPALDLPLADLGGLLLPAVLSFSFFVWTRRGTLAASLLAYLTVLVYLLAAHLAPVHSVWHRQPNLALPLAAASLLLWRLNRTYVSLAAAALGLLLCAVSAGLSVFWETTVPALALLTLAFALHERRVGVVAVWPLTAALTLEVLLLEQRVLPWAQTHGGWEPNYGSGLVALTVAGLVWADRRQSRDWLRVSLAVAGGTTLLEIGDANLGHLPFSPLVLLGLGAALSAAIALVRRLPYAAVCAVGLTGVFYLAFVLGYWSVPGASVPAREAVTAVGLAALALLTAWMAVRLGRSGLACPAALALALAEAHGLHRFLHPDPVVYLFALWPTAAALYVAGVWPSRLSAGWRSSLQTGAAAISISVLLAGSALSLLASAGWTAALIAAVCLYGTLYTAVGYVLQAAPYIDFAAAIYSGAFWLTLVRLAPTLTLPRHAFLFSLSSLLWLGFAAGTAWVLRLRFAGRALSGAAVGVGLAAVVVALAGRTGTDDRFIVYTLLVAGTALIGAARSLGSPLWGHAGVAAYFAAYFAFLVQSLGSPGLPNSDFYLIPAGLYVLALGIATRRNGGSHPPAYFLAGLLLTMTPTFAAADQPQAAPLHAVLLLTECVAALFFGIAARIKVFVGAGGAFLIALVIVETQGLVGHLPWAVYATGLGLAILGSALYFEKRGEKVRRWAAAARTKLSEWD